jgi:hypothetical protein
MGQKLCVLQGLTERFGEKYRALTGIWIPDHPVRSLFTTPSTLSGTFNNLIIFCDKFTDINKIKIIDSTVFFRGGRVRCTTSDLF